MRDFLVEIHTEELPPKSLQNIAVSFLGAVKKRLLEAQLTFDSAQYYATPRRFAVIVHNLLNKQPDIVIERKGPALQAAFDPAGKPTLACIGFAKSCGTTPDQLITLKNNQGAWVGFRQKKKGSKVEALLPPIVHQALNDLPIAKRMRWGDHPVEFVRPVHSVLMLYDKKIISGTVLGLHANRKTRGHRFLSKGWISVPSAQEYESLLEKHFVIVDFEKRKQTIRELAEQAAKKIESAEVVIDEPLLNEVTGLVEWPVPICGHFDEAFLLVPQEVLISAMQDHQRYFPIKNTEGHLQPYFIAISNIESKDHRNIVSGNERVLRARLSDAAFFFTTDKKQKLMDRVDLLKNIVFQKKLGSLYDKAHRLAELSSTIAKALNTSCTDAKQAGLLAKADLTTQLVGEFPELQGLAGYYYALHEQFSTEIAEALYEQYLPRFSGDRLPVTLVGATLALADRLDTLAGMFGIHEQPTGDKDPLALRRAALGVVRILIDKRLDLDLHSAISAAIAGYEHRLENENAASQLMQFILERLRHWYQEQGISPDIFASVTALPITRPYDIHRRILAVEAFKKLPEAEALAIANKRVSNILSTHSSEDGFSELDVHLFEHDSEKQLAAQLIEQTHNINELSHAGEYTAILTELASLKVPIDAFFDKVLVMTDDKPRRNNRLILLKKLRQLFLNVADIALLQ